MAVDYEDKVSAARSCCVCGREFSPEERYLSALFEQGEEFHRRDYCQGCWQGPPEGSFSYWRGRLPAKEERPERFVDEGELLELFARLEGVTEPRQSAFRYLLGLLLARRQNVVRRGDVAAHVAPDAGKAPAAKASYPHGKSSCRDCVC